MPQFADLQSVTVGDFKVTFLPDGGGIVTPTALYPASTAEGWKKYPDLLDDDGNIITSIGGFLIETGDRKIIIDTGIGPATIDFPGFGPFSGGKYLESLAQTGVGREDVTDVIFTHLHLDHCGWTTVEADGERPLTFPNARHFVTQAEWDFWYGGDNPAGPHPEFVQKPLADRIQWLEAGADFLPGLTIVPTPGHTPGHVSLKLTAGEERLFLIADVMHGEMQIQEPEWGVAFDIDPDMARQTRDALYPELMRPNTLVGANHFSDRIFGRIVERDGQRQWQPLG
jgi:glyoxylase-like metal-dependent hydrolase (beta-lactamase superfamily II)